MSVAEPIQRLAESEYLELERRAETKSEFFEGEMFAMSGGAPLHSQIATNLPAEFRNQLKGRNCVAYNSDLRLKAQVTGLITHPDLSVICGPLQFAAVVFVPTPIRARIPPAPLKSERTRHAALPS